MMQRHKTAIALVVLLCMTAIIFVPAAAAAAPVTAGSERSSSGSSGLLNILLGLLLGKLIGGSSGSPDSFDISKVLGLNKPAPGSGKGDGTIVTAAKKYMGVPYVWGGETPSGFDCSGFTRYVMKERGVDIPRTAAEQFAAGKSVSEANLQVGDMVFFTTYKPGASHVGFYMGDRQFIHASSSAGKVTISSLDEEYFKARYLGARRY